VRERIRKSGRENERHSGGERGGRRKNEIETQRLKE